MMSEKDKRLIEENMVTDTVCLYIGYSKDAILATKGRAHTTTSTNVYSELVKAFLGIYDEKVDKNIPIRRIGISFINVTKMEAVQLSLFVDQEKVDKERNLELAINSMKNKMGRNTILRGMNLQKGATTQIRNKLIGGHNSE